MNVNKIRHSKVLSTVDSKQNGMDFKKKKFSKKINKFNPKKRFKHKPKVKQHVREDDEIKNLQEGYENIKNCKEIQSFEDFPLSRKTLKGLKENYFKTPTEIQKQAIGPGLKGCDILGASQTGSGKTLAFLIPILERLYVQKWSRMDGVGAVSSLK